MNISWKSQEYALSGEEQVKLYDSAIKILSICVPVKWLFLTRYWFNWLEQETLELIN